MFLASSFLDNIFAIVVLPVPGIPVKRMMGGIIIPLS
jgi:hypothetical protein